jgi:hypothetical protein
LRNKQDIVLDKDKTMDDVQILNICAVEFACSFFLVVISFPQTATLSRMSTALWQTMHRG